MVFGVRICLEQALPRSRIRERVPLEIPARAKGVYVFPLFSFLSFFCISPPSQSRSPVSGSLTDVLSKLNTRVGSVTYTTSPENIPGSERSPARFASDGHPRRAGKVTLSLRVKVSPKLRARRENFRHDSLQFAVGRDTIFHSARDILRAITRAHGNGKELFARKLEELSLIPRYLRGITSSFNFRV